MSVYVTIVNYRNKSINESYVYYNKLQKQVYK